MPDPNTQVSTTPTYLNTNVTTDAGMSVEMKTHYDNTLLDEAQPELVHDQFGQRRPIPQGAGKKIEFRRFASLPKALGKLVEGVTPDGKKLSASAIEAEVGQYGDYVPVSDMLKMTTIDPIIVEATKVLGNQSGKTLDTITRNELQKGTNVFYVPKTVDGSKVSVVSRSAIDNTCTLSVDAVERAVTMLKTENAPKINGDYVAIVHPHVVHDLRRDPEFIEWHKYAQPGELYNGEVGKIAGVRFVETTEAKIYSGADLTDGARTLAVNNAGDYSAATTIAFDGGTVAADALIGREIIVNGYHCLVADNTDSTITIDTTALGFDHAITCSNDAVIYPGEGGAAGVPVYGCLFLGRDAYGVTEITGGGLKTIIKPLGSGGTADPLDQRATIGWKATKTAKILQEPYILRVECGSSWGEAKNMSN